MTKLFNDNQLTNLAVPTVQMKQHQLQLKHALLSSAGRQTPKTHQLKTGWRKVMTKKPLTAVGVTLGAAAMAITIGAFNTPQNSAAYAQGIAKQSAQAVSKMTPDDKKKIISSSGLKGGIETELKEAQNAKDAVTLTYDQVVQQYPKLLPPPPPKSAGNPIDLHSLKFIKFTDSEGRLTVVGIGSGNVPVMVLSFTQRADTNAGHTPQGGDESYGQGVNDGPTTVGPGPGPGQSGEGFVISGSSEAPAEGGTKTK